MILKSGIVGVTGALALIVVTLLAAYGVAHRPGELLSSVPPVVAVPFEEEAVVPLAEPATRRPLALLPDGAQVALAFPSLEDTMVKMGEIDRAVGLPFFEEQLAGLTRQIGSLLGAQAGVPLTEIVVSKGFDSAGPVAVFLNTDKTIGALGKAAAAKVRASVHPKEDPTTPASDMPDAQTEPSAPESDPGDAGLPSFRQTFQAPEFAVVLPLTDAAKVRQWIEETLGGLLALSGGGQPSASGGPAVQSLFGYGFFITENQLVVGQADLVKKVAEQVGHPTAIRYGTPACPPTAENEVVGLVYPGRILPMLRKTLDSLTQADPVMASATQKQGALLDRLLAGSQDDPVVASLAWREGRLSLRTRLDTVAWPAFTALAGLPVGQQLPTLLPDNTSSMLSLSLTNEMKMAFREQMLALAEGIPTSDMALAAESAPRVLELAGSEAILSINAPEGDIPAVLMMVALANPVVAQPLLNILLTTTPGETYNGVSIGVVSSDNLIPLYMAYVGPNVVFSTSVDQIKEVIDRQRGGDTSAFVAAITSSGFPPSKRYAELFFQPSTIDAFSGVAGFLGMDASAAEGVSALVQDFRAEAGMRDAWAEVRMTLRFRGSKP